MTNSFGDTYSTGTISLANGSTHASFSGTLMTTQAEEGDLILVNNLLLYVSSVIDDTHIDISVAWAGTSLVTQPYLLMKASKARYDPAITQKKVREMLAFFEGIGIFYFVTGSVPDSDLGVEGQWALKVNDGSWRLWYYTGGVWVLQGVPTGVDYASPLAYASGTTYALGKVVTWQGSQWRSRVAGNIGHTPDTSPTQWELFLSGGDSYDVVTFDTDRPASGELVLKLVFTKTVTFYAGLVDSRAKAEVAATASSVYSYKKNNVQFATLTFGAASATGVFAAASNTVFTPGDVLTMIAPASRDATLSGVGATLSGYR